MAGHSGHRRVSGQTVNSTFPRCWVHRVRSNRPIRKPLLDGPGRSGGRSSSDRLRCRRAVSERALRAREVIVPRDRGREARRGRSLASMAMFSVTTNHGVTFYARRRNMFRRSTRSSRPSPAFVIASRHQYLCLASHAEPPDPPPGSPITQAGPEASVTPDTGSRRTWLTASNLSKRAWHNSSTRASGSVS